MLSHRSANIIDSFVHSQHHRILIRAKALQHVGCMSIAIGLRRRGGDNRRNLHDRITNSICGHRRIRKYFMYERKGVLHCRMYSMIWQTGAVYGVNTQIINCPSFCLRSHFQKINKQLNFRVSS